MTDTPWTNQRVELLKELWPIADESARKIAAKLGGGITRCAVIGKAARLGLPPKGGAWTKDQRRARAESIAFLHRL